MVFTFFAGGTREKTKNLWFPEEALRSNPPPKKNGKIQFFGFFTFFASEKSENHSKTIGKLRFSLKIMAKPKENQDFP